MYKCKYFYQLLDLTHIMKENWTHNRSLQIVLHALERGQTITSAPPSSSVLIKLSNKEVWHYRIRAKTWTDFRFSLNLMLKLIARYNDSGQIFLFFLKSYLLFSHLVYSLNIYENLRCTNVC
jgi:hypothetical protein